MEQHTISNHQIASFAGKLQEDERSPATIENYSAPHPGFRSLGRGAGRHQRAGCLLERALNRQRLPPRHRQHHAGVAQPVPGLFGVARLRREDPAHPAAAVPGGQQRADPRGVRAPGFHRTGQWPGAAGASVGNHLLHRHPRLRGQVYHRRGPPSWKSGNLPEGQDTHHPAAQQAVPEAAEVCQKTKDRLRRGVPHQKRHRAFQKTNLGGDEVPLRKG